MVDVLCIIGGGNDVLADYAAARKFLHQYDVLAVNDMIAEFPFRIKHAVSVHPTRLPGWLNQRCYRKYNLPATVWSNGQGNGVSNIIPDEWRGSSGMYAVKVGLEIGYNKIILCGVPMQADAGHYVRKQPWNQCEWFIDKWARYCPQFADKVCSMSGYTRELLGGPTHEWLT